MTDNYAVSSSGYDNEPFRSEERVPEAQTLIGRGIYTVAEAARLVGLQESKVRRWTRGYWYTSKGKRSWSAPLVGFGGDERTGRDSLSFADLIEVLYLEHFANHGVRTVDLRRAADMARVELRTPHPFGTNRYRTDGRWILEELRGKGPRAALYNVITAQLEPHALLKSLLKGDLDLDGRLLVERWWPLTKRRDVVVDPRRRFGAPISDSTGIPTDILFKSFRAERSYARVASWYAVSDRAVRDAVRFEKQLAA